ncbi:MAG: hypothetical protein ABW166_05215 [Sedimenticola sp.]
MPKYNVIFESNETILGVVPRADDWVEYSCILKVKHGGKLPASLHMKFIPPHPFLVNMPLEHSIRDESIFGLYGKVVKFFAQYGVEFRGSAFSIQ